MAPGGRVPIVLLLLLALHARASAADGDLIERSPVNLPSAALEEVAARFPVVRDVAATVTIERIIYRSDGLDIAGYLAYPSRRGRFPALIVNRGGNWDYSLLNDRKAFWTIGKLASWGYVVAASQYREGAGSQGTDEYGGADVADVLNLIPLLERLPRADTSRLGLYGWSRGGMMTYRALAESDRFAAAIVGAAPTDFRQWFQERPDCARCALARDSWGPIDNDWLERRSVLAWMRELDRSAPLLLLHGSADQRVSVRQVRRLAAALRSAGHPHELRIFDAGDHGLLDYQQEIDAIARDWLGQHLARD